MAYGLTLCLTGCLPCHDSTAEEPPEESAPKRRRVGPAAPSAELLAAAAAYHADIEAAGGYMDTDAAAEGPGPGHDQDTLIGPPPPEFVDEADAAPADAREAAVVRVMRVLREAAAIAPAGPVGPQAAPAAAVVADPYAVLGVEPDADTAAVRKAYWRLSLLVHPDKCSHVSAHEAFQAVSKAAKLLQDAEARKAHDAAAEDAALRKAAIAAAAAAERQAAWATARGEAVPAEVAAQLAAARAAAAGPAMRESWMTDLPPEKRQRSAADALAGLSQVRIYLVLLLGTLAADVCARLERLLPVVAWSGAVCCAGLHMQVALLVLALVPTISAGHEAD